MMENDDEDYIRLNNMYLVLKKHYQLFNMLENKLIRNNTLVEINLYNI